MNAQIGELKTCLVYRALQLLLIQQGRSCYLDEVHQLLHEALHKGIKTHCQVTHLSERRISACPALVSLTSHNIRDEVTHPVGYFM